MTYILWSYDNSQSSRKQVIAAYFQKSSPHNRTSRVIPHKNKNPFTFGALAAKFALDTILELKENTQKFKEISHITICSTDTEFLRAVSMWQWVCKYQDITYELYKARLEWNLERKEEF